MNAVEVGHCAGERSDAELVEFAREGDDCAFEELYRRYHHRVARFLLGRLGDHGRAEDLTQETFVSALRRLRATDTAINFRPWIFEIAKNASIDQFRRARRTEEVSLHHDSVLRASEHVRFQTGGLPPETALISKERLDHLRGAFGELSQNHSRILLMREFEGLSYREIGEQLGMTRPAVESTLFRARRRLQREFALLAA